MNTHRLLQTKVGTLKLMLLICWLLLGACTAPMLPGRIETISPLPSPGADSISTLGYSTPVVAVTITPIMHATIPTWTVPGSASEPALEPTTILRGIPCGNLDEDGHILFLYTNMDEHTRITSRYNLAVMNGNGCFPRLILENVSGSPAWSKDWKKIAIGCENNTALCILDAVKTLRQCTFAEEHTLGRCEAAVLQKYSLPNEIIEDYLDDISWSPDASRIAIQGRKPLGLGFIWVLTLANNGKWELLVAEKGGLTIDWSPKEDLIAVSGMYFLDLKGVFSDKIASGSFPQWSTDGSHLVFRKESDDKTKEYWGIASLEVTSRKWYWLSEPMLRSERNLYIHDSGQHRIFSWSPDEKHIAFFSIYLHDYDYQIFRLDIATNAIVVLTKDLSLRIGGQNVYAPAWGP